MHKILTTLTTAGLLALLSACSGSNGEGGDATTPKDDGTHVHEDGSTHADHGDVEPVAGSGHAHDEVSLGTADIAGMNVECAQGHGNVAAGKEGHLVVKLPYTDGGATIVRVWIGTEDRTLSYVGNGDYAPSRDQYDIHATAPDPLPANVMWWIEIEKPDGTTVTGSVKPLLD